MMPGIVAAFPPINIDISPKRLVPGEKTILRIILEIPEGFDIMAHKPSEEFLIPAELKLVPPEGIITGEPVYPEPEEQKFDWLDTKLRIYQGRVEIKVPIEVSAGNTGIMGISGSLSFQGCTRIQCLPPKKQDFSFSLEIVK